MRYKNVGDVNFVLDFSELSDENQKHLKNYNILRRHLFLELEQVPEAKEIFKKFNVYFVNGDDLAKINIDFPREE